MNIECIDYTGAEAVVSVEGYRIVFASVYPNRNRFARKTVIAISRSKIDPNTYAHYETDFVPHDFFVKARELARLKMREARKRSRTSNV